MTIWQPDLARFEGPRYQAIAGAIADDVRHGRLRDGDKLPPVRNLAWRLGVTVGTVNRGYMLAESRGLVVSEVGRGTFVRAAMKPLPQTPSMGERPNVIDLEDAVLNLARNVPAGQQIAEAMIETLRDIAADGEKRPELIQQFLSYGDFAGARRYRAVGAHWMQRTGLSVSQDQIIVTGGAQQALSTVFGTLAEPGERILVERLTYSGLQHAAHLFRLKLDGLEMDDEGVLPHSIEAACAAGPVRLLCLVPTIQNPTGAIMGQKRREEIVGLARKHDLLIVEDDVYGFLPTDRPPPLAALAPERTIYIASASKCLTPGLRCGWIASPPAYVERFIDTMHTLALSLPTLPLEVIARWVESGTAEKLVDLQRQECRIRQEIASEIFKDFTFTGGPFSFHIFLQLPDPWRAQEFVAAAETRGIAILAAGHFAVGRTEAPHAVRISIGAAPSRERLRQALMTLADMARKGPATRRGII